MDFNYPYNHTSKRELPRLDYETNSLLNEQTAYNKTLLASARICGCFYCLTEFHPRKITNWLDEEDGDDTAICPICGNDTVIVGTDAFPLSHWLLSSLCREWFPEEFKRMEHLSTPVPQTSIQETPHQSIQSASQEEDSEGLNITIKLIPTRIFTEDWGDLHDNEVFFNVLKTVYQKRVSELVTAEAYLNKNGYYCCKLINSEKEILPYEPWTGTEQELLLELSKQYGKRLAGIISQYDTYDVRLKLFVDHEH